MECRGVGFGSSVNSALHYRWLHFKPERG